MFAQVSTQQVVEGFGLPAAIVIIALVTVIIFLYRDGKKEQALREADNKVLRDQLNAIQEQRIRDAKETRDKIMEPFEKIALLTQNIYDTVNRNSKG